MGTVDAFAGTAWVWCKTHPRAYELETRKQTGLDDDEMFDRIVEFRDDLHALTGVSVTSSRGDLSGMRKATEMAWNKRLRRSHPRLAKVGIRSAPKREKAPRIRQHYLEMVQRRYAFIAGGILDFEGRHLRYKKDKPDVVDKDREVRLPGGRVEVPGDHGHDAMLYATDPIPLLSCKEPDVFAATTPGYFRLDMY